VTVLSVHARSASASRKEGKTYSKKKRTGHLSQLAWRSQVRAARGQHLLIPYNWVVIPSPNYDE
jgi:hypothetical protein